MVKQRHNSGFIEVEMKTLYLIGGTMGVGKTAVSQQLKKDLPNSVFLDGDWCWDATTIDIAVVFPSSRWDITHLVA